MFTKKFWRKALERAGKSAGQAGLIAIGADQVNVLALDWATFGGFVAGGAALSVLTSLASIPLGPGDDPSAV